MSPTDEQAKSSSLVAQGLLGKTRWENESWSACSCRSMTSHWRITSLWSPSLQPLCHTQLEDTRRSDSGRRNAQSQRGGLENQASGYLTHVAVHSWWIYELQCSWWGLFWRVLSIQDLSWWPPCDIDWKCFDVFLLLNSVQSWLKCLFGTLNVNILGAEHLLMQVGLLTHATWSQQWKEDACGEPYLPKVLALPYLSSAWSLKKEDVQSYPWLCRWVLQHQVPLRAWPVLE